MIDDEYFSNSETGTIQAYQVPLMEREWIIPHIIPTQGIISLVGAPTAERAQAVLALAVIAARMNYPTVYFNTDLPETRRNLQLLDVDVETLPLELYNDRENLRWKPDKFINAHKGLIIIDDLESASRHIPACRNYLMLRLNAQSDSRAIVIVSAKLIPSVEQRALIEYRFDGRRVDCKRSRILDISVYQWCAALPEFKKNNPS